MRILLPLSLFACAPAWDEIPIRDRCFAELAGLADPVPDYDQFAPTVGRHCAGTNHQDIEGIERLVFLGDSVTAGTPPTQPHLFYRNRLADRVTERFGAVEVSDCSAFGARTDDLLLEPHQQVQTCFPEPDPRPTLVVMTMGGNDMFAAAEAVRDGLPPGEVLEQVDAAADHLRDNEGTHFGGGVSVIFAGVYEYTDGTGDMGACPAAELMGFAGNVPELRDAYIHINERYVEMAVQTGTDVIFLLEQFCGHGFHAGDPANECYRGPDARNWFDGTCIHPNPEGHQVIADLFDAVVGE